MLPPTRATEIPVHLDNGGTLKNARLMAAPSRLCDRAASEITLDEIERITI
jgi:hypothetical protein